MGGLRIDGGNDLVTLIPQSSRREFQICRIVIDYENPSLHVLDSRRRANWGFTRESQNYRLSRPIRSAAPAQESCKTRENIDSWKSEAVHCTTPLMTPVDNLGV